MKNMIKNKKNLEKFVEGKSKVIKFKPLRDSNGRYIPYCDFGAHQGIVRNFELCEARDCKDYRKLYIYLKT